MFSKSAQSPSIIRCSALRHSSIAFVSYSIILSIICSFLLFPLFSSEIKNSTPLCVLGKKRKQTWSALFPNNAPFRIKSEFPGFEFWSSDFVYSHITWKYNSPKQSGLFSFASHCCLDIIHLWGNLETPPSTFAFECIQFIDVTQVHNVLIATFIQNLWRVYKLYIFGKFRVWWTPKPVFPFFFKSLCGWHFGLSKWPPPGACF